MTAALRETKEEIGLDIDETNLRLISLQRAYMIAANKAIENEFQWLYMLQLDIDQNFNIREAEVACLIWKPIGTFKSELNEATNQYVPHGSLYYQTVTTAIESASHT